MKNAVSGFMLFLLFVSILTITFNIYPVKSDYVWSQTIYIKADGNIEPSGAPISRIGDIYKLTDNIVGNVPSYTSAIVIERNNIVLDGNSLTVQGQKAHFSVGISLQNLNNVTIANVTVKDFYYGIKLNRTSSIAILGSTFNNTAHNLWGSETTNTTIFGNYVTGGSGGLYFYRSFNDTISGNNITSNNYVGIQLTYAYNAKISGNSISKNKQSGPPPWGYSVLMYSSANSQIYDNNITEGHNGINLDQCNNTEIYQNNIATHNWMGIALGRCINVSMYNNLLNGTLYGFDIWAEELSHYLHSIDTSNLIDGKPMYYLINQHHLTINASTHPEIGFLALINSTNITIEGLNCTKRAEGILLAYTNNTRIQNNNLTNNYNGICLDNSLNSTITGNVIQRNNYGIYITNSTNTAIGGNTLEDNDEEGIDIYYSTNCTVCNNEISGNNYGIRISYSSTVISENNISAFDHCISIDSSENIIYANNIMNGYYGISLGGSSNNIIRQNNITNSEYGIYIDRSNDNTICENNIVNNTDSIYLSESENNKIYHNNFINNTNPISSYNSQNAWDNGYPSGGNYWSDHLGVDADYDGISDMQYEIDANNVDMYPLMGSINVFDAGTWDGIPCNVDVVSNSKVSNFQLNIDQKMISFNVTGLESTHGFCRITIPKVIVQEFWQGNYTVLLNGEPCLFRNWTDTAYTYIYVNYTHSEHQITIIPEFSPTIILPLLNILLTTAIIFTNKIKKKWHNTKL
jgi:parallel beta-helix repeat protein